MDLDWQAAHVPPASPWRQGWLLRSSAWSSRPDRAAEIPLRTLASPGDLAPLAMPPPWSFHLGLGNLLGAPEVRLLANGFLLTFPQTDPDAFVYVLTVSPGLVVGQAPFPINPSIFCPEQELHEEPGLTHVETEGMAVALRLRMEEETTCFRLAISSEGLSAALAATEQGLDIDFPSHVRRELELRKAFWSHHRRIGQDQSLLTNALERMVYRLEPPSGRIPDRWVSGERGTSPAFPLRALYSLVRAWLDADVEVAMGLLRTALAGLSDDGALPATMEPTQGADHETSTWPLLVASVWSLGKAPQGPAFIAEALPALHRYLLWALRYFDPEGRGMPCWRTPEESLISDAYDQNLCSAGLAALLLRELDFFLDLLDQHPDIHLQTAELSVGRERIAEHLTETLWDNEHGVFRDHYIDGDSVSRMTFSGVVPLLWNGLESEQRNHLMRHLGEKGSLRRRTGVGAWQSWENDEAAPPVVCAHQMLLLDRIREIHPSLAMELSESILGAIRGSFAHDNHFPYQLNASESVGEPDVNEEPEIQGACLVILCSSPLLRKQAQNVSHWAAALDRHRGTVALALATLLVLAVGGLALREWAGGELSSEASVAAFGLVDQMINARQYDQALRSIEDLKGQVPQESIDFYMGLVFFQKGDFATAEDHFRSAGDAGGRGDKARLNLALSQFRQGKIDAALEGYSDVIQRYEGRSPGAAQAARAARNILLENRHTLEQSHGWNQNDSPPGEPGGEPL